MNKKYCVYMHTTPSGKRYIGITCMEPNKRWKNGKGYELCTAFNRAIIKYGWENIKHDIIATGLDKETACREEQRFIKLYKTTEPKHGYNLTSGGEHYEPTNEWRDRLSKSQKEFYKNHPEAKIKISEMQKGRKTKKSTREKMSVARKEYIKNHPEAREKCRQTFKGMKRSAENCQKIREANEKRIVCIETGKVYKSINQAAFDNCVCRTAVTNNLTGRSKTCNNLHFEYCQ